MMTRNRMLTVLFAACLATLVAAPWAGAEESDRQLFPDPHSGERTLHKIYGTSDLGPVRKRAFAIGTIEKRREKQRIAAAKSKGLSATAAGPAWSLVGPLFRPNKNFTDTNASADSGMIANIALHPTDANTIYVAAAGGGVWKTTDGGTSWASLFDNQLILPVGAVAVAASAPNRVYAGSGCGDESSSSQDFSGFGLAISSDAGATWRQSQSSPGSKFSELMVDPENPDILLSATDRGVMRSTDGGDTWAASLPGSPIAARSLSRATNKAVVFAGTWASGTAGSIWKSTDGGVTFTEKTNGLPGTATTRGRGEVAVAPSDVNRVYALFAGADSKTLDMVRSTDGGETWTALGLMSKPTPVEVLGTQGNAFADLAVDPTNPQIVYAGGLDLWKSVDGGDNWNRISNWGGPTNEIAYVHADHHSINFGTGGAIYFTADGGIFRSTNGGTSYTQLNRGLATLQFYYIAQTAANPSLVMAGAQDNGTSLRRQGTEFVEPGIGGDGFGCYIHATNPLIMIGSAQNNSIARSTDGGLNFAGSDTNFGLSDGNASATETPGSRFATGIRPHPTVADTVYCVSKQKIWQSKDAGASWATPSGIIAGVSGISDFNIFPADGSRIVLVTDDSNVFESTDDAKTFTARGTIPMNQVNAIRYDRTDARWMGAVSASVTPSTQRFAVSTDGGATWAATGTGLPDVPVHTLLQDVRDAGTFYAGTYIGVYRSTNKGQAWERYGTGLPNVMVFDMLQHADGTLRAGTFGRAIWEINTSSTGGGAPVASFTFSPSSPKPGETVTFSDTSTGSPAAWSWELGNGTTATTQSATATYADAGSYAVKLTVSNANGSSSVTNTVNVSTGGGGDWVPVISVPGQARAAGSNNSFFRSSFWMTNPGAANIQARLKYVPAKGAGNGGGSEYKEVTIIPNQSIAYGDVLADAFGASTNTTGVIVVEVPAGGAAPLTTSRTFNDAGALGTFGQYIPGVPLASALTGEAWMHGLGGDDASRSNVGVANLGTTELSATISVFDATGAQKGTDIAITVPPQSSLQTNRVNEAAGAGAMPVFSVRITSSSNFFAYTSKLDNKTSDPIFISSFLGPRSQQWIDGLAAASGTGGTLFRSNLSLTNRGTAAAAVTVKFTKRGETTALGTSSVTLAPGESKFYTNAVTELFNLSGVAGQASFQTAGETPIVAWCRTYNDQGEAGTFGQFIPAFGAEDLIAANGAIFQGLSEDSKFRTNMGFVNTSASATTATVSVWSTDGTKLAEKEYAVEGGQAIFKSKVMLDLGASSVTNGYVKVIPAVPNVIYAWASSVDNTSTDQTFVRPLAIP